MTATLPPRSALAELPHIDTKAACGTGRYNPELWHSVDTGEIDRAKSICLTECAVMRRCRAWALATEQKYGVWGGLSAKERGTILETEMPPQDPDEEIPEPPEPEPTVHRVLCGTCDRRIGLDRKGRLVRHMDWVNTFTLCVGSLQPATEVQA